jgi:hypothetical protein
MGACAAAVLLLTAVLAPSHGARLQNLLVGLYNPTSASYRHFLAQHDELHARPQGTPCREVPDRREDDARGHGHSRAHALCAKRT